MDTEHFWFFVTTVLCIAGLIYVEWKDVKSNYTMQLVYMSCLAMIIWCAFRLNDVLWHIVAG